MRKYVLIPLALLTAGVAMGQNPVPVAGTWEAITPEQRLAWFAKSSFGAASLLGSLTSAGIDTLRDTPPEYGPHWQGFGKRYGLRVSDRVISSGIEASLGALWGEDPRYFRVPEKTLAGRLGNVMRMTVISHDRSGHEMPAYARFVAAPASGFLSNAWVPDSQRSSGDALNRIGVSAATQMLRNALTEFWPDVRRRMPHRNNAVSAPVPISQAAPR